MFPAKTAKQQAKAKKRKTDAYEGGKEMQTPCPGKVAKADAKDNLRTDVSKNKTVPESELSKMNIEEK